MQSVGGKIAEHRLELSERRSCVIELNRVLHQVIAHRILDKLVHSEIVVFVRLKITASALCRNNGESLSHRVTARRRNLF